jgi:hypothetical protein
MKLKNVLKNYLSLIAVLGFGVVVVGSGYQGLEPNAFIAELGVAIIFVDMFLWSIQKHIFNFSTEKNNSKIRVIRKKKI